MGKKKKKEKKAQKEQQKKLLNMNCEELIEQADHALLTGNSRKAVKLFKSALKKVKEPEQKEKIKNNLFDSYIAREKELRNKNMTAEAEAVLKQAMDYTPDFSQTTEDVLISFLDFCENHQAFKAYSEFLGKNENSIKIERLLAEKV
ncbi:MAG: hypothetical protein U9N77_03685, partial [Thermodesulfobacteriota bacterium]|nr:hypothetical protein [Thermodesulfobacteriota bacterium]